MVKSSPQCRHPDHDFVPHSPVSVFSSWWELFFPFCLSWRTYSCMEFSLAENKIGCCKENTHRYRCWIHRSQTFICKNKHSCVRFTCLHFTSNNLTQHGWLILLQIYDFIESLKKILSWFLSLDNLVDQRTDII